MDMMVNYMPALIDAETARGAKSSLAKSIAHTEGSSQNDDVKKVAKEMEALFIYELLKVMRKTSESMSSDEHGMGKDTYMQLFDMELSKVMADKGMGLQDSLEKFLLKKVDDHANVDKQDNEK